MMIMALSWWSMTKFCCLVTNPMNKPRSSWLIMWTWTWSKMIRTMAFKILSKGWDRTMLSKTTHSQTRRMRRSWRWTTKTNSRECSRTRWPTKTHNLLRVCQTKLWRKWDADTARTWSIHFGWTSTMQSIVKCNKTTAIKKSSDITNSTKNQQSLWNPGMNQYSSNLPMSPSSTVINANSPSSLKSLMTTCQLMSMKGKTWRHSRKEKSDRGGLMQCLQTELHYRFTDLISNNRFQQIILGKTNRGRVCMIW